MKATINAYCADRDVFTVAHEGFAFEVKAKHIPLIETESEPCDAIGREFDMNKTVKGIYTQAHNAAQALEAQEIERCNAQYDGLFRAISNRQALQPSRDNEIMLSYMTRNATSVKKGMLTFDVDTLDRYISMQRPTNKGENFVAVKANVKIACMLAAIGADLVSAIDSYSATIIANALHNSGTCFAKTALVALSKDIEYDAFDSQQIIKARMRKHATTASTQRSSSREMLRVLGLASVTKAKTDDSIVLTEKGQAVFDKLFA